MSRLTLLLAYNHDEELVPIVTVATPELILAAAEAAIAEAESRARALQADDPVLASLEQGEAAKLRSLLAALAPKAAAKAVM